MAYEVDIQVFDAYIRFEASGKRNPNTAVEDAITLWSSVVDICKEQGIFKILAIGRITGYLSTLKGYEIASSLERLGLSQQYKVAMVDLRQGALDDIQFSIVVATNRGYNIKLFDNEQEAKVWLLQEI